MAQATNTLANPYTANLLASTRRVQEERGTGKREQVMAKAKAMNARIRLRKLEAVPAAEQVVGYVIPAEAVIAAAQRPAIDADELDASRWEDDGGAVARERPEAAAPQAPQGGDELLHEIGRKWSARRPVWMEVRAFGKLADGESIPDRLWNQIKKQVAALGYARPAAQRKTT